eukprot:TRINITY_DN1445_c0_g1_i3.p2 TRINITY_DN1445_c0_g1~~TRINITY_DN1445_c0_g1_i3.p2  ORF type:complete len:192 (-),score=34.59 TRINITY_DN1445_c0_g1_i3:103-630(-)
MIANLCSVSNPLTANLKAGKTCRYINSLSSNRGRTRMLRVQAQEQKEQEKKQLSVEQQQKQEKEEQKALERIQALESGGKKKSALTQQEQQQTDDLPKQERAEWKEGKLFPEGWEEMNIGQKVYEFYVGERGLLFWMNKIAFNLLFVIVGVWILFRFVGPALNLYELQSGFEEQL